MKCLAEIECSDPELVVEAVSPEIESSDRVSVKLKSMKNRIDVMIESNDVSGLMIGFNSSMRLIKASMGAVNNG